MSTELLAVVIAVCLVLSAYFSATETAYSSFRHVKMKAWSDDGNKKAARVLEIAENFDRVLSTILIGNNVVNIVSASLATVFFARVIKSGVDATTVSTVVMTLVVLIFAEITPKSLAKERPERFLMNTTWLLTFFMVLLTPLNVLFGLWKKLLSKVFKKKDDDFDTEQELITLVEEAEEDGKIDEDESELIRSAIEFDDTKAIEIFTPRVDVVAIPLTASEDDVVAVFNESGYSRLPVYKGTVDNIVGVLNIKDFYGKAFKTGKPFKSVMKPPVFVAPSIKVSDLLSLFQKSKTHLAVISDEFGGTEGIVTMEDILEELVGEIWDEHDDVVEEIREFKDGSLIALGTASPEDVFEKLDVDYTEEDTDAETVGGFVIEKLGKIPNEGDSFVYEDTTVTVLKTDYRRVVEVKFDKSPLESTGEAEEKTKKEV